MMALPGVRAFRTLHGVDVGKGFALAVGHEQAVIGAHHTGEGAVADGSGLGHDVGADVVVGDAVPVGRDQAFSVELVQPGQRFAVLFIGRAVGKLAVLDVRVVGGGAAGAARADIPGPDEGLETRLIHRDRVLDGIDAFLDGLAGFIEFLGRGGNFLAHFLEEVFTDEQAVPVTGRRFHDAGEEIDVAVRRGDGGQHRGILIDQRAEVGHLLRRDIIVQRSQRAQTAELFIVQRVHVGKEIRQVGRVGHRQGEHGGLVVGGDGGPIHLHAQALFNFLPDQLLRVAGQAGLIVEGEGAPALHGLHVVRQHAAGAAEQQSERQQHRE